MPARACLAPYSPHQGIATLVSPYVATDMLPSSAIAADALAVAVPSASPHVFTLVRVFATVFWTFGVLMANARDTDRATARLPSSSLMMLIERVTLKTPCGVVKDLLQEKDLALAVLCAAEGSLMPSPPVALALDDASACVSPCDKDALAEVPASTEPWPATDPLAVELELPDRPAPETSALELPFAVAFSPSADAFEVASAPAED